MAALSSVEAKQLQHGISLMEKEWARVHQTVVDQIFNSSDGTKSAIVSLERQVGATDAIAFVLIESIDVYLTGLLSRSEQISQLSAHTLLSIADMQTFGLEVVGKLSPELAREKRLRFQQLGKLLHPEIASVNEVLAASGIQKRAK